MFARDRRDRTPGPPTLREGWRIIIYSHQVPIMFARDRRDRTPGPPALRERVEDHNIFTPSTNNVCKGQKGQDTRPTSPERGVDH